MQINEVLKNHRKYVFIDCGIKNYHLVFVRERYRQFCAPSVHRSLWTIVIHLFILIIIEINNYVGKYIIWQLDK